MTESLFVTGTDTGVGKTQITTCLLQALKARGEEVIGFKPLETGFPPGIVGDDGQALARASQVGPQETTWRTLTAALAPSEAARIQGEAIDVSELEASCRAKIARPGGCIIEGAGGILVPITQGYSYLDFASAMGLRTIVVAANRLGVLNHTLLTVSVLKSAGVPILGVVLNEVDDGSGDLARETNPGVLQGLLGDIPLAQGAYLGPSPTPEAAQAVGESILNTFF